MRDRNQSAKSSTSNPTETSIKITRTYQDFPAPSSASRGARTGKIDARSLGASTPQGQRLGLTPAMRARIEANRRNAGAAAADAGRFLRATGGQGVGQEAGGGGRGGGRGGRGGGRRRPSRGEHLLRLSEKLRSERVSSADEIADANAKIQAHLGPPPRQWVDHVPEDLSLDDLRQDWPTIPTGNLGIIRGVEEKLRWMARRMQHGYDTPQELAIRLHKGKELVHFESAAEKEQVLTIAKELADKAAARTTERTGQVVEPKDHSFEPIRASDRAVLSADLIKGIYPPIQPVREDGPGKAPQKKMPAFLNEVRRMLGNNETYQAREMEKLCFTIQKLVKPVQRGAGARA
jgi:hypothetical protein